MQMVVLSSERGNQTKKEEEEEDNEEEGISFHSGYNREYPIIVETNIPSRPLIGNE